VAEGIRRLRTNLQFLNVDSPPKVFMVSSSVPAEGKTTLTVNLALALAESGHKVTIVEADLRKPRVTRTLGLIGGVGLTNVLSGTADLGDVLQRHGERSLSVIASGPTPPNPGELLASSHMLRLIQELRDTNDFVLLDAPPVLPVADASGLAVLVDGVVLVVRYGKTRRDQVVQTAATLKQVGATTFGVVLNMVPQKAELTRAYGYEYSADYAPETEG
jgi:receptor protein-tyrosine kinase